MGDSVPDKRDNMQVSRTQAIKGRSSRNLSAAILVGSFLGLATLLALFLYPVFWVILLGIAIGAASFEVSQRFLEVGFKVPKIFILITGELCIVLSYFHGAVRLLPVVSIFLFVQLFIQTIGVNQKINTNLNNKYSSNYLGTSVGFYIFIWLFFPAMFDADLINHEHGNIKVGLFIGIVVGSDIFGYMFGVLWGRHKLAPILSPNKTWEGLCGSLIGGMLISTIFCTILLKVNIFAAGLLAVLLVITGVFGDLLESSVKRELNIKDMGTILPGHGGIMDRLDSLAPAALTAWVIFSYLPAFN